jgi:integrase
MLAEARPPVLAGENEPYRPKPQVPRPRTPGPVKFRNAALHEWKYVVTGRPRAWPEAMLSRREVLERLERLPAAASASTRRRRAQGTTLVLDWLASWPGRTWQERWVASAADTAGAQWDEPLTGTLRAKSPPGYQAARVLTAMGISQLLLLRLIRPGYPWLYAHKLSRFWEQARQAFDPQGFARLTACLEETGRRCGRDQAIAFCQLTRMLVHNGGTLAEVTVADCLEADAAMRAARDSRCAGLYYDLLFEAGFLPEGSPPSIRAAKRRPLTVEELVDGYGIECTPVRDLFVGYLRERQGALDYSSLRCLVNYLVLNFWKDLEAHHPQISSLHLTPKMAADWKQRLKYVRHGTQSTGTVRKDPAAVILAVRAFYSDIAHWALEDPARWGPWAAPNPVRPADTAIQTKVRRQQTARMHQRTRELAPALPKLMAAVHDRRRAAARRLTAALAAGDGQQFEAGGARLVRHVAKADLLPGAGQGSRRVYAIDAASGKRRDLTFEEDDAFWAWAVTEVLRHTGIRLEEMLELTHHSFTAYRLPGTGELIPLLQIAPSKTDRERLLVVSPELAEVLTAIIFRVRGDRPALPLTPRYDVRERLTSPPMPYLMQRRQGPYWRVISDRHVQTLLERALAASGLSDAGGKPLRYTPHDFRRIFATEAVAAGLPLPILAKLMGHQNVVTTQEYAAIYPQDVIQHHRAFIERRRELRPSAEYRHPTDAEWEEFLGHFERRKVELGVCARAYGSPCQHEHACIRCPMLRPDPQQAPRLTEIIGNLQARLSEAHSQGWLGEVEGIETSLTAARQKLNQMKAAQARPADSLVNLGLPTISPQ